MKGLLLDRPMGRRELLGWGAAALSLRAGARQKVLYFTRSAGYEHSPVKREGSRLALSEQTLTEMGRRAGFDVECTKDGRVFDGDLSQYDLFAFYTTGDLTQPDALQTPPMTAAGKRKFLDAIAAGKGFVGFHSATDTFHSKGPANENQKDLDPYIAMLGGEFIIHGAQQEASLLITSKHPSVRDLGMGEGIAFKDEWYALKNFAPDLHVVLVQETKMMKGECYQRPNFPCTWARAHGKGRVFYTSLGHREDIWTNPFFQTITMGGMAWALGNVQADITPNIDKVTPQASQLRY